MMLVRTHDLEQTRRGSPCRAGAEENDLDICQTLALQFECVEQGGADDDGGTVLVIVEYRDVQARPQFLLDAEAMRCGYVFQIDAAEGGSNVDHGFDEGINRWCIDLDIEYVNAGKALEQHRLAFHHRLAGQCADVAQPQHRCAVGDDRHQVALVGVSVGQFRVAVDFAYRFRHAWRVSQ